MDSVKTHRSLLDLYESMRTIRAYDERLAAYQQATGLPGTCTAVGQEAAAVGVIGALAANDLILTNHRSSGHLLARGADAGRMMAEVLGKRTGYCGGKSGSLHISVKELGVVLTSTIVGGELSLATGVALSQRMLKRDGIVVCIFGDGAACEGIFHESLNLASVWDLPILYVCENNQWQAYVHRRETMRTEHVSAWGEKYGMDTATVNGNDVHAVLDAARTAAGYVRSQRRPYLLETSTYRLRGHVEPDDQSYVERGELEAWRKQDPLEHIRARLLAENLCTDRQLRTLESDIDTRMEDAMRYAQASEYPEPTEATTHVYA